MLAPCFETILRDDENQLLQNFHQNTRAAEDRNNYFVSPVSANALIAQF